jgi:hypothetical protein
LRAPAAPRPGTGAQAQSIAVRVAPGRPGPAIPASFLGLSVETTALQSPAIVTSSPVLVRLLRQLGAGVLRISGVSVDRTQWLLPGEAPAPWQLATIGPVDLAHLAALMSSSGWRLLLGLDLGHANATALGEELRAAQTALSGSLAGVQIGNEPDLYTHASAAPFRSLLGAVPLRPAGWGQPQYEAEISQLRSALAGPGAAGVSLYGPDTAGGSWLAGYAQAQGAGLGSLAQHFYPLDRCHGGRLLRNGASLATLLSPRVAGHEEAHLAAFMRVANASRLPLRMDEANSVACAGQPRVSDTFGAALWALDFSLLAAREGVSGLNFHGGLGSCGAGGTIVSPWYSPLCTAPDGQISVRPEYYALLLVRSLEGCSLLPVHYRSSHDVAVFALQAPDGSLRVLIDDMDVPQPRGRHGHSPAPAPVSVAISAPGSYTRASVIRLTAPSAAARAGTALGGATVAGDGSFGLPVPEQLHGHAGRFRLRVSPASAQLVTLAAKGAPLPGSCAAASAGAG